MADLNASNCENNIMTVFFHSDPIQGILVSEPKGLQRRFNLFCCVSAKPQYNNKHTISIQTEHFYYLGKL